MAEVILALWQRSMDRQPRIIFRSASPDYRLRSPGWHMVYPLVGNLTILTTVR